MVFQTILAYIVVALIILGLFFGGVALLFTGNPVLEFVGLVLILASYLIYSNVKNRK